MAASRDDLGDERGMGGRSARGGYYAMAIGEGEEAEGEAETVGRRTACYEPDGGCVGCGRRGGGGGWGHG